MEATQKDQKGGEISMAEKKVANGGEVVVEVTDEEAKEAKGSSSTGSEHLGPKQSKVDPTKSVPVSCSSPEIFRSSPSPKKPPKAPTSSDNLTRRKSFNRSVYSKPKSRFCEPSVAIDPNMFEEKSSEQIGGNSPYRGSFNRGSPQTPSTVRTVSITTKTPLMGSPGGPGYDDREYEEIYKKVKLNKEKRNRVKSRVVVEWVIFWIILCCLVASLTIKKLESLNIWELEFWKWCVLVLVTISGMLVSNWFMRIIVFIIERNFLLRKKVLYFVHGLKKSVQFFIWLGLVLLTWVLLINRGVNRSKTATKILDGVTWTLVSILIGAFLWLIKTTLLKILASNFHVKTFFDRIQDSIFHQYVLQTLSGPPLIEQAEKVGRSSSTGQLSFRSTKGKGMKNKELIDMGKLHQMKQEKVSAWTMKVLVDAVTTSGLSTISNTLDEMEYAAAEQADKEITNEMEATAAAYCIFKNVAEPGCKYIDEDDLLRFMIKEEVDFVLPLFEVVETGKIERKALTDWVVKVYKGRKALSHSLNDTKTAVKQLNKLVTAILIIVNVIVWLLLMEIATTKILVFLSSQLVVAAFMFGNTCKTIFESIIFVFVMHPFDVGDRCVVDGIQLMVEEMNILTTIFLKLNNEKVSYPNSVLSTKPISNYYRSPDMGDAVEFGIDFLTPMEKIGLLKERIKKYLDKTPHHWHPEHGVVVSAIEDVNKIKMALYVTHTMNFQDWGEKNKRRSDLVIEMKKIFEDLNIKYNLLPQTIHLVHPVKNVMQG